MMYWTLCQFGKNLMSTTVEIYPDLKHMDKMLSG